MIGALQELACRLAAMRPAQLRLPALRRDVAGLLRLEPVFHARNRADFRAADAGAQLADASSACLTALRARPGGVLHWKRFCLCCNETRPMRVDFWHGSVTSDGARVPNWRERLVCCGCRLNNRQRLAAKLVQQATAERPGVRVYLMEQITPMFRWVRRLPGASVVGSEYLGPTLTSGEQVRGIRHEDVMALSFADASFDLIVSNDVLEHIPDPHRALQECFRVLAPGGSMLATFPFMVDCDVTVPRARLVQGTVEHLQPAQYHGNPLSADGSLVFTDFGWDFLDSAARMGFTSADCEVYGDDRFGHLGDNLLVFRFRKPGPGTRLEPRGAREAHASGSSARMSSSESLSK